ncbi:MAG: hypothetical protein ACR2KZ_03185 [Segetibacter sp.]
MKLFISFILVIVLFSPINSSYAISFSKPVTASASPPVSVLQYMKASEFIKLSPRDLSAVTGKKLSLLEKVSLKVLQIKMKHYVSRNPNSTLADYYSSEGEGNFNLLWFLAGLLVPLLSLFVAPSLAVFILLAVSPVILALIIKRDWVIIKSVLIGFGIAVVLLLLLGLVVASDLKDFH